MINYPEMSRIAGCLLLASCLFARPVAAAPPAAPQGAALALHLADGMIVGPGLSKPTPVSQTTGIFEAASDGALNLRPDAPLGHYTVTWTLHGQPKAAGALTVTAATFATDANQPNFFVVKQGKTFNGVVCGSSQFWTPQTISGVAWPIDSSPKAQPILLEWSFNKPVSGGSQIVHLSSLTVAAADAVKAKQDFMTPIAEGLPPPADPAISVKPWVGTLQIKRGVIYKGNTPFFPIGFTGGLDERSLAEQKAMGCTAIHTEVGWNSTPGPGTVPASVYDGMVADYQRAGEWGFALCPLLTGHYTPGWFAGKYPNAPPMGSDGKGTGGWFPYSTHYPPFLQNIPDFWKGLTPVLSRLPNVLTINLWNEPNYGGGWLTPYQFADYSDAGISDYRAYLRQKYATIDELNQAHHQQYASFDAVQPPHTVKELGPAAWLEWLEYGDGYFAQFFNREHDIIKQVAPHTLLANKKETQFWGAEAAASGNNWSLLNTSEDVSGVNLYISSETGERDILEGAHAYAPGKPVIIYETNVMPPGAANRPPDRIRTQLWSQILGGADGMFIYSLNPGDPDHGIPNDKAVPKEGRVEYVRFIRNVARLQRELASPFVPAHVAVLYSRTATLVTPGPTMPSSVLNTYDLVRNAHFAADFLPEERCTADGLKPYQVVVLPSHTILKKPELAALAAWVQGGGKVLSFGHALATDELLLPISSPAWMELGSRAPAMADRTSQVMARVAEPLQPYSQGQTSLTGVELVSQTMPTSDAPSLVPGMAIKTNLKSEALGWSADSYPVILRSHLGNVVYCAFESQYSPDLSALTGGLLRVYLGQHQEVSLLGSDNLPVPTVLENLRQDPQDPTRRYLIAVNISYHPAVVRVTSQGGWRVVGEKIMGLPLVPGKAPEVTLEARNAYLFVLERETKAVRVLPRLVPRHPSLGGKGGERLANRDRI